MAQVSFVLSQLTRLIRTNCSLVHPVHPANGPPALHRLVGRRYSGDNRLLLFICETRVIRCTALTSSDLSVLSKCNIAINIRCNRLPTWVHDVDVQVCVCVAAYLCTLNGCLSDVSWRSCCLRGCRIISSPSTTQIWKKNSLTLIPNTNPNLNPKLLLLAIYFNVFYLISLQTYTIFADV